MAGIMQRLLCSPNVVARNTPSLLPRAMSSIVNDSNYKTSIVNGARMEYLDVGKSQKSDETVVFLHGNPTSSYLWRNVIPHISDVARCIAPDLIGMGRSQKLTDSMYTFEDQFSYVSKLLGQIDLPERINLVVHDWGSALGFHWAHENKDRVQSISFMEALVAPIAAEEFPEVGRQAFAAIRSRIGEELILENNIFVEQLLPIAIMRQLTSEEMEAYRKPFAEKGESRRPTLTFPRELIIEGVGEDGPDRVRKNMLAYGKWLSESSSLPKLYIDAQPGMLAPQIRRVVKNWPNLKIVEVPGLHFLQEDSPDEIGRAIRDFLLDTVFSTEAA